MALHLVDRAFSLLDEMPRRGITPRADTYNSILTGLIKVIKAWLSWFISWLEFDENGDMYKMKQTNEQMPPDVRRYRGFPNGALNRWEIRRARWRCSTDILIVEARSSAWRLPLPPITWSDTPSLGHYKSDDVHKSVVPPVVGRAPFAWHVFGRTNGNCTVLRHQQSNTQVLQALCLKKDVAQSRLVYNEMRRRNVKPDKWVTWSIHNTSWVDLETLCWVNRNTLPCAGLLSHWLGHWLGHWLTSLSQLRTLRRQHHFDSFSSTSAQPRRCIRHYPNGEEAVHPAIIVISK